LVTAWVVGLTTFVGLLAGFLWLRRWKRRSVAADTQALAERTQTEFAEELEDWPEHVDLTQPAEVERMLTAMEMAGTITIRRPWKGPRLFHRFFAPF
jgi:hypothetical protein